ncbi:MAG: hypothetical protein H6R06_165 [Proteobacteria bacterium]|nr:hypothetical protein [Pseudomonadota bacterium]
MNGPLVAELQSLTLRYGAGGLPAVAALGSVGALQVGLGAGAVDEAVWPAALFDALAADAAARPEAGSATQAFLAEVAAARSALEQVGAVWLRVGDGVPASQVAWIAVFGDEFVQLVGVQALPALPVELPGFEGEGTAWLGVSLRLRGQGETLAVERARLLLLGAVHANPGAGVGAFVLEGAHGTVELSIQAALLPPITALLDDPQAALQGVWDGELKATLGFTAAGSFFGLDIQADRNVSLDARVRSLAGNAKLQIEHLQLVDAMTVGGGLPLAVSALRLTLRAKLHGVRLDNGPSPGLRLAATGLAHLTLDIPDGPVLAEPLAGAIDAEVSFEHEPDGEDRLALRLAGAVPVPGSAVNRFGLAPADLQLTLLRPPGVGAAARPWQLALRARFVQPWQQVAAALHGALRLLPGIDAAPLAGVGLPDLRCALHVEVSNSPRLRLDLELVEQAPPAAWPAGGTLVDRYSHYDGPLGPLPLDVADATFRLELPLQGDMTPTASGQLRLTSAWQRIGAADVLPPLAGVLCQFALQPGEDGAPPSLKLSAERGFPPLRLPVPGRAPITLIHPERFELAFGQAFELSAEAVLADQSLFDALRDSFDLPADWQPLVDALQAAVAGVRGSLRLCLPLTEAGDAAACQAPTLRIELRAGDSAWIDLFETLAGAGAPLAPVPADTPTEADRDGRLDQRSAQFELVHDDGDGPFALRTQALVFEVALPDSGAELHLQATVLARVLGETFDAGLYFDFERGQPALRLATGVEDPVRIAVPGAAPGFVDITALVTQVRNDLFGRNVGHDGSIEEVLQDWNDVFATLAGSADEPLLVFELKNLQLRFAFGENGLDVGASGGVQIVQLPPLLNDVLPLPGPTAVLGATATSIFIELQPPLVVDDAQPVPLISIPLARAGTVGVNGETLDGPQTLDLYFGGFALGYSWAPSAVQLRLKAGLGLPQALLALADFSPLAYRLPPGQPGSPSAWIDVELRQLTAQAPPILLWNLKFGDTDAPHADNRGFEYVLQVPRVPDPAALAGPPLLHQQDLFVQYLRRFSLIPMTQLMYPAIELDWGVQVGPDRWFDAHGRAHDIEPVLRLQFRGTTLQLLPAPLVVFFPWAATVPPLLPIPPWSPVGVLGLWPGFALPMLDFYTGEKLGTDHAIQVLARIPGVVRIEAGLSRPMPSLPIPALIELALLGQRLLSGDLDGLQMAADSAVRDIAYLEADLRVDLPVLQLFGDAVVDASPFPIEAHVRIDLGDALNAVFPVVRGIGSALVAAQDAAAEVAGTAQQRVEQATEQARGLFVELDRRQSALLKLAPLSARRMHHSLQAGFRLPGFSVEFACSIAVCLLAPDELAYELRLYHERLRPRRQRLQDAMSGDGDGAPGLPPPLVVSGLWWMVEWHTVLEVLRFDSHPRGERAARAARTLRTPRLAEAVLSLATVRLLEGLRATQRPKLRANWLRGLGIDPDADKKIGDWARNQGPYPEAKLREAIATALRARQRARVRYHHSFVRDAGALAEGLAKHALHYETDDKLEPWRAVLPLVDAKALVERHLPSQTVGAATAARLEAVVKGLQRGTVGTAREIDVLRADLERQLAAALGPRAGAREPAALLRRLAGEAIRTKAQPRGRIVRGDPQALEARVAEMLRAVHRPGRWIARFDELARRAATGEATHEEFERALRSLTAAYARLLEEAALVGQQQGVAWADVALVCLNLSSRAAGLPAWQRVTGEFKAGYETSRLDLRQVGPAWAALLAVDEPRPPAGPGAAARCRVAQGYALFCRGAGGALLDESVFMLPVNSANPLFDVVAQAGSYRLRCWAVERIEAQGAAAGATTTLVSEAVLPPAVTALEADTPGKAGRLRARLELRERAVEQPAAAPPAQALVYGAQFHRESVFWTAADAALPARPAQPSPLFELAAPAAGAPLPGSHGRLNIADLLVRWPAAGPPSYIVPNRPVLLAGLDLTLLTAGGPSEAGRLQSGFVLKLRGLVLPGDEHSSQVAALPEIGVLLPQPPSLFFAARVAQTLHFGNAVSVELDGEFRYLAGPAWDQVSLHALDDGLGFEQGLRFRGLARLRVGGKVVAEGAASGGFDGTQLNLFIEVALNLPPTTVTSGDLAQSLSNDLIDAAEFPGLARVTYSAQGQATLALELSPSRVAVTVTAENLSGYVQVDWEVLEEIPEVVGEVCSWVLELYEAAADFAEALVEQAVDLVESGLADATGNQVNIRLLNPFGDDVVIGVFKRVCEDVIEIAEQVVPQSTRFPALGGDAEVSVSGSFDSKDAKAVFDFGITMPDDRHWGWRVELDGAWPDWFVAPG